MVRTSENRPDVPCLAWSKTAVDIDVDDAMDLDDTTSEVQDWLQTLLQEGPVGTKQIQREARKCGHAWRTVERAKTRLNAIASILRPGPPMTKVNLANWVNFFSDRLLGFVEPRELQRAYAKYCRGGKIDRRQFWSWLTLEQWLRRIHQKA